MSTQKYVEYMQKEAGLLDWGNVSSVGKELLEKAPYLLLPIIGAGTAAGFAASKATSPTDTDIDKLQNDFLREKLRLHVARRQREAEILKLNAQSSNQKEREARDIMI